MPDVCSVSLYNMYMLYFVWCSLPRLFNTQHTYIDVVPLCNWESLTVTSTRYPLNEELDSVHSYLAFSPLEQLHPYLLDEQVVCAIRIGAYYTVSVFFE